MIIAQLIFQMEAESHLYNICTSRQLGRQAHCCLAIPLDGGGGDLAFHWFHTASFWGALMKDRVAR